VQSSIYNSKIKYKYSTSTLGVAIWQKRNSCIVCLQTYKCDSAKSSERFSFCCVVWLALIVLIWVWGVKENNFVHDTLNPNQCRIYSSPLWSDAVLVALMPVTSDSWQYCAAQWLIIWSEWEERRAERKEGANKVNIHTLWSSLTPKSM